MEASLGKKPLRVKFWIMIKIVAGFIVMSYFIWLLANKDHFLNKFFSKEFIDFLKLHKKLIIALTILLAIKLINKICSLFARGNYVKGANSSLSTSEYQDFSIKKISIFGSAFFDRLSDVVNNYARENQFGISYYSFYKGIKFFSNNFSDIERAVTSTIDFIIKKVISIVIIVLISISIHKSLNNINHDFNLIPEHLRDNKKLII